MPDPFIATIDTQIATARENLRNLIEQATRYSGAADETHISNRIADQETRIEQLIKQRELLCSKES